MVASWIYVENVEIAVVTSSNVHKVLVFKLLGRGRF